MIEGDGAQKPLPEPWVTLMVEGKPRDIFLVDTGAQHSILKQSLGKMSPNNLGCKGGYRDELVLIDYLKISGHKKGLSNTFFYDHP